MQPRFPFPGMPPPGSGGYPGAAPPQMPGYAPHAGFPPAPGYFPPGSMPPPPHMMHPGMHGMPGMPGMPPMAVPPVMHAPVVAPPVYPGQAFPAPPAPVPPRPAASVIVGAPVMRVAAAAAPTGPSAPTPPVPVAVMAANTAINDFNYGNSSAVFLSATSNIVNKHIFQNAAAALPLTLYVGQVPLDMPEAVLMKMLESCGRIFKLVRPIDPASQLPASFALVTYSQGLCALRCLRTLNGYLIDKEDEVRLVVKMGSKEKIAVDSIMKSEDEAAEQLSAEEGQSLQRDIYDPIRAAVDAVIAAMNAPPPPPPATAAGASTGAGGSAAGTGSDGAAAAPAGPRPPPPTSKRPADIEAGEIAEDEPTAPAAAASSADNGANGSANAGKTSNYYQRLDGLVEEAHSGVLITATLAEQVAVDEAGEKMLMSEIEQFRLRQLQRDKDKEEERKQRVKQKMAEMRELAKQKAEREARELAEGIVNAAAGLPSAQEASNAAAAAALLDSVGSKRRAEAMSAGPPPPPAPAARELSAEELEAKRRRKLQVLRMLAGDDEETAAAQEAAGAAASAEETGAAASAADGTTAPTAPTAVSVKKPMALAKKAVPGRKTFGAADEDEAAPRKEMILLEYTEQELREMANQTQQYLLHADDHDSLEEDYTSKKRNLLAGLGLSLPTAAGATPDLSSIQAKVQAQAQAISAALALKTAQAAAAAVGSASAAKPSSSAGSGGSGAAGGEVDKERLKTLVNKIPTEKDELFAYPLDWAALDAQNIISDVMASWVSGKITEYLGEEEVQLRDFIVGKLRQRCQPADLLEELGVVMDEAALPFVLKLWRMLVYYSVKSQ